MATTSPCSGRVRTSSPRSSASTCSALLEVDRATGKTGEIVQIPAPLGIPGNPQLRLVLLVGVGDQRPTDFRRAGAALARAVRDRASPDHQHPGAEPHTTASRRSSSGRCSVRSAFHMRSAEPEQRPVARVVLAELRRRRLARCWTAPSRSARAGWRARALATVPSNLKTPAWLAEQAQALAADHGLKCRVWDEKQLEAEGFGGIIGVGQGSAHPPRLVRLDYTPEKARRSTPHRRARRQGHHLRHRRPDDQARRGDGQHEARHDRWRRRAGDDGGARRRRLPGARDRAGRRRGERHLRIGDPPRRRDPPLRRPHQRGHQHRRRGSAGARRRDGVRRRQARPRRARRRRHPDRRRSRWRSASRSAGCSPTATRSPTRCWLPARPRASRCGGCRWSRTTRTTSPRRSPTPTTRPKRAAGHHRRAVPPALRRRRPVGPPRHRVGRRRAGGELRVDGRTLRVRRSRAPRLARLRSPPGRTIL